MQSDLFEVLGWSRVYRITITGSRIITDEDYVFSCLDDFLEVFNLNPSQCILNSGNARGVDRLAEKWAISKGIEVKIFKPDWSKGKGAGLERNKDMVNNCEYVCSIWDGISRGTKHCVDYAIKKGKEYKIYQK